ncbi:hypothetical protein BegalDRAFT_1087 [Beggiatoa alba B18LD]|uniref:Flagellar assembly protein H n=1 Tax=Beggiatoa alba B18LD TaxID=395493 RepID=I3CEE7_9GAMM|nr:hypothetical protein [Beggiatoa alba]EIJ41990.1 hypothetical protein BegalDRAFT_1087 [Beggiatoa alba B18LD]
MLEEHVQRWYAQGVQLGVQQGIERGIEQGIQRGIERGMERGIEQGQQKEKRRDVLTILEIRFGELPVSLVEQINVITDIELLAYYLKQAILSDSLSAFQQLFTDTQLSLKPRH